MVTGKGPQWSDSTKQRSKGTTVRNGKVRNGHSRGRIMATPQEERIRNGHRKGSVMVTGKGP